MVYKIVWLQLHTKHISITIKTESDEKYLKDLDIHVTYRHNVGQIAPVGCNHMGFKKGRWCTQTITVL